MDETADYLPEIRDQYEHLPYPHRDPEEERTRLIDPCSDRLSNLNHYCYRGRRRFDDFRVLVAGGGTGDGTVYLALQLRDFPGARVVHLDLSTASIDVARRRAEVRGLSNIEWVHGSLLDLPTMGLGPFDYINCTGVLMILEDPDAGLAALKSVLDPAGAMSLMLYAQHGRTGVYQMQTLMRLVNEGQDDMGARLANARKVLASLPPTNWFKRGEDQFSDHARWGDAGLYDLFLIERDRAYTVPETYAFVERAGLHLIDYCWARERLMIDPETYVTDPALLARIAAMPLPERRAIGELISGRLTRQHVYAAPQPDRVADPDDPDNVPFLVGFDDPETHARMADHVDANPNQPFQVTTPDRTFTLTPGPRTGAMLRHLDGDTAIADILARARDAAPGPAPSDAELTAEFRALYDAFRPTDSILLRHRSVPAVPEMTQAVWEARRAG
jgi:2-polyprenyl-3-methyl-5-hydroxy-6-metoxy-1,4-benzoquinol methylase